MNLSVKDKRFSSGCAEWRTKHGWLHATGLILFFLLLELILSGCAGGFSGVRSNDMPVTTVRATVEGAGIVDQRPAFAKTFCGLLGKDMGNCDRWLMLPEVPLPQTQSEQGAHKIHRTIVIIPGIFGECVSRWVTPFSDSYSELKSRGYDVWVIPVEGRSSSERNARIIDRYLRERVGSLKDAVVIGYSKGVTDFMRATTLDSSKHWVGGISAFVSVAGVVNGTPLAGHMVPLYDGWLSKIPFSVCGAGDGGGVSSLSYRNAMDTAKAYRDAENSFRTYSIVAIADPKTVNTHLAPSYYQLAVMDDRNDGQIFIEDAILPGSTLLGVLRGDHWSVALPFSESQDPIMRSLGAGTQFPRAVLLWSLLTYIGNESRHREHP